MLFGQTREGRRERVRLEVEGTLCLLPREGGTALNQAVIYESVK